eukprot:4611312-Ditylum_brightwellii.AAC.1
MSSNGGDLNIVSGKGGNNGRGGNIYIWGMNSPNNDPDANTQEIAMGIGEDKDDSTAPSLSF